MQIHITPDYKTYKFELRKLRSYGLKQHIKNIRVKVYSGWSNIVEDGQTLIMGEKMLMNPRTKNRLDKELVSERPHISQ